MPQEDDGASELNHPEEIFWVIIPANDGATKFMKPDEQVFDFPAAPVAARSCPEFFAHFLRRRSSSSARLPRGEAKSFCAVVHAASLASARRLMSRWHRVPHFVPATWRSLAAASMSADFPSGNTPTTLVRRTSRRVFSSGSSFAGSANVPAEMCTTTSFRYLLRHPLVSSPSAPPRLVLPSAALPHDLLAREWPLASLLYIKVYFGVKRSAHPRLRQPLDPAGGVEPPSADCAVALPLSYLGFGSLPTDHTTSRALSRQP
jgi:hypothetical protein